MSITTRFILFVPTSLSVARRRKTRPRSYTLTLAAGLLARMYTLKSMWWDRLPVVKHASRLVESAFARLWAATSHSAKCRKVARKSRLPSIGAMPSWLSVRTEPITMICIFFRIFLGESGIFCIFAAEMNYQY